MLIRSEIYVMLIYVESFHIYVPSRTYMLNIYTSICYIYNNYMLKILHIYVVPTAHICFILHIYVGCAYMLDFVKNPRTDVPDRPGMRSCTQLDKYIFFIFGLLCVNTH